MHESFIAKTNLVIGCYFSCQL